MKKPIFGIDIGGSSLKFAPVDISTGHLTAAPQNLELPQPATASALLEAIEKCRSQFAETRAMGVGFPGVIKGGVVQFAPHLEPSLVGHNLLGDLKAMTSAPVALLNDADAAGLAETRFGAGTVSGMVLVLTLGTGIGSALIHNGKLFPNTEFGHLMVGESEAEQLAAGAVRREQNLSWSEYGERLDLALTEYERLLNPDRIVLGGGISENFDRFRKYLRPKSEIVPAALGNSAGLIGAALAASELL